MKNKNNEKTKRQNLATKSRVQKKEEYRVELGRLKGKMKMYKERLREKEDNGYSSFYKEHVQIDGVNGKIKFYEKKINRILV